MTVLRLCVPLVIALWFVWRARRTPVYICALPLILALGPAAFLPGADLSLAIPLLGKAATRDDLLLLLMMAAWLYVRQRRPLAGRKLGTETVVVVLALGWLVLGALAGWATGSAGGPLWILFSSRNFFYLGIGFVIWVDVFRRTSRREAWAFFGAVAFVSVVLMIPYALSAVGLGVYATEAYAVYLVNGSMVVRDFATFPVFAGLALAYYLTSVAYVGVTWLRVSAVVVLLGGVALMVTRSTLLTAALVVVAAVAISVVRPGASRRFWMVWAVAAALLVALGGLWTFAESNVAFLGDRLAQVRSMPLSETSLGARFDLLSGAARYVASIDPVFGLGVAGTGVRSTSNIDIVYWGDAMWYSVVVFLGFVGVAFFIAIIVAGLVAAARLVSNKELARSRMGSFVFLLLVWEVGTSVAGSGYMRFFAITFLTFAILVCELRRMWLPGAAEAPAIARTADRPLRAEVSGGGAWWRDAPGG